jgi:LPS export ABC transporter permease LptG
MRGKLRRLLGFLRGVPFLGWGALVIGFAVFFVKTWVAANSLFVDDGSQWPEHYRIAVYSELQQQKSWEFFRQHWIFGAKCLLPAFLLGLVRLRGPRLLVPITFAVLACFLYWVMYEVENNFRAAHLTTMGEVPTPDAYYGKLWLTAASILSLPVMLWLYWRSSTLDRYLVRSFVLPLLICLLGMISIMVITDLLSNAQDLAAAGFSASETLGLYLRITPMFFVLVLDIAVLLAVLFTLTRMSRSNEIISMLGSGRSLMRLLTPIYLIALWLSLLAVTLNYELAPNAQNAKDEMLRRADATQNASKAKARARNVTYNLMYRNREQHRTWFVRQMPNTMATREKMEFVVMIQDDGKGNYQKAYFCNRATWVPFNKEWRFYEGEVLDLTTRGREARKEKFDKLTFLDLDETPWVLLSGKITPDFLSVPELLSYVRTNHTQSEARLARYRTAFWSRIALPLRCWALVLVAAPLAIVTSRRGSLSGVFSSIGIFILGFFAYAILVKLAEGSVLSPLQGPWITNAVLFCLGILMIASKNYNWNWDFLKPWSWFRKPKLLKQK